MVERSAVNRLVVGSNPTTPVWEHSSVVEQRADNAEVDSSNLSVPIWYSMLPKINNIYYTFIPMGRK